jgi:hypothetical protein
MTLHSEYECVIIFPFMENHVQVYCEQYQIFRFIIHKSSSVELKRHESLHKSLHKSLHELKYLVLFTMHLHMILHKWKNYQTFYCYFIGCRDCRVVKAGSGLGCTTEESRLLDLLILKLSSYWDNKMNPFIVNSLLSV